MNEFLIRSPLRSTPAHEKLILAHLATQFFANREITTTEIKARKLQPFVERLMLLSSRGDAHSRRRVRVYVKDRDVVNIMFTEIGPALPRHRGEYTSLTILGARPGDGAQMARLALGFDTRVGRSATAASSWDLSIFPLEFDQRGYANETRLSPLLGEAPAMVVAADQIDSGKSANVLAENVDRAHGATMEIANSRTLAEFKAGSWEEVSDFAKMVGLRVRGYARPGAAVIASRLISDPREKPVLLQIVRTGGNESRSTRYRLNLSWLGDDPTSSAKTSSILDDLRHLWPDLI